MAGINDEKLKLMEDEMNRFEAEIALPVLPPPPPPPPSVAPRQVIGSNTYTQVQRRLEEQQTVPVAPPSITDFAPCPPMGFAPMMPPSMSNFPGIPPPPPPPPPLLVPHQVQRGPPLRHPVMRPPGMGAPAGPPMMGGPPPPPPRFMGPPAMNVPGPPFMGPGPPAMPVERLPAPVVAPQAPVPAIVSATPKLYVSKPELPPEEIERKNKKQKSNEKNSGEGLNGIPSLEISKARDMAEKVKASIVQTVTVGPVTTEDANPTPNLRKEKKKKKLVRMAGGQIWEDNSLMDWEDDDFRIFCGDLGNDVTDEILTRAFSKYQSFLKAKVVRDKRSNKTKGFGFVSFKDPQDFIKAMKEMNGRYVGSRPIKLRKSTWKARNIDTVRKKEKEKAALTALLTGR